jgi:hypothetical protein
MVLKTPEEKDADVGKCFFDVEVRFAPSIKMEGHL